MSIDNKLLDDLNWKILAELQRNARISYTDLGKKIGLTGPAVSERILKMEDAGIIKGYRSVIDLEKIGYSLTAIINFKINPGNLERFINYLKSVHEVFECIRITGSESMLIKAAIKQPVDLEKLVNNFIEYGTPTTSIILSTPIEYRVFEKGL